MSDSTFSSDHPHYTPEWLSIHIAKRLDFSTIDCVIDPACGAGNLLSAAALLSTRSGARPRLFGIDKSIKATERCRRTLGRYFPEFESDIQAADFLGSEFKPPSGRCAVIMNPPFKGYGTMSARQRQQIRSRVGLSGRFNLAHAFVVRALSVFSPSSLVAILPSNWHQSDVSHFRIFMKSLARAWTWAAIEVNAFPKVSTHVGVLEIEPNVAKANPIEPGAPETSLGDDDRFQFRNGVATGSDATFRSLATAGLSIGRVVPSIRGRDLEQRVTKPIWLGSREIDASIFAREVSESDRAMLAKRSCVRSGKRSLWEYHEALPNWFLGTPKVLLAEVSVEPRIWVDEAGTLLPLNSTIAVKAPSAVAAKALGKYLESLLRTKRVRSRFQQLGGGAIRLSVKGLRRLPIAIEQSV